MVKSAILELSVALFPAVPELMAVEKVWAVRHCLRN